MDELLEQMSKLSWWVGSVFLPFIIGILGIWLGPSILNLISRLSVRVKKWQEKKSRVRELIISNSLEDPSFPILSVHEQTRRWTVAMYCFVLGMSSFYVSQLIGPNFASIGSDQHVLFWFKVSFDTIASVSMVLTCRYGFKALRLERISRTSSKIQEWNSL